MTHEEEVAAAKAEMTEHFRDTLAGTRVAAEVLVEGGVPQTLAAYAKAFFDAYTAQGLPPEIVAPLVVSAVQTLGKPGE